MTVTLSHKPNSNAQWGNRRTEYSQQKQFCLYSVCILIITKLWDIVKGSYVKAEKEFQEEIKCQEGEKQCFP